MVGARTIMVPFMESQIEINNSLSDDVTLVAMSAVCSKVHQSCNSLQPFRILRQDIRSNIAIKTRLLALYTI